MGAMLDLSEVCGMGACWDEMKETVLVAPLDVTTAGPEAERSAVTMVSLLEIR